MRNTDMSQEVDRDIKKLYISALKKKNKAFPSPIS